MAAVFSTDFTCTPAAKAQQPRVSYGNSSAAHGHPVVLALVCCTVEHTMTEESCLHVKHHVFAANSAGGRLPSADAPWPAIAEVSDVAV